LGTSVYQGFPVSEVQTADGISLARMLFFKAKKSPKIIVTSNNFSNWCTDSYWTGTEFINSCQKVMPEIKPAGPNMKIMPFRFELQCILA
jgi:hypothetical protein